MEPDLTNDPASWDEIIREVETNIFPGLGQGQTFVAGGAVRDRYLGREPKDVDVFIRLKGTPYNDREVFVHFVQNWARCKGLPDHWFRESEEHYAIDPAVVGVATVHWRGMEVQFIGGDWGPDVAQEDVVTKFDFGASQAWYDPTCRDPIRTTPAFERDMRDQTFTIVYAHNADSLKQSLDRWSRLSKRFPDWSLARINDLVFGADCAREAAYQAAATEMFGPGS